MRIYLLFLSFLLCFFCQYAVAQNDGLVELTGKVIIDGSSEPLGGITVSLMGSDRGMVTNNSGMFSIVMKRGQQLKIESDGFKSQYYTLPNAVTGKYHTTTISVLLDTIYLKEFIYKQMTPEEFDFAFKYKYLPDEWLVASRNNMSPAAQQILIHTMQRSGAELQSMQQMNNYIKYGNSYGQQDMSKLGNPAAWKDFIESWKRGDFKGKK